MKLRILTPSHLIQFAPDISTLYGLYVRTLNAEALVAATREIGLEVSADKTKYMVMSRDQITGRNQSVRIDNSTLERVAIQKFKYQGIYEL